MSWSDPLPGSTREFSYLVKRYAKDSEYLAGPYALAMRRSELFPFVGTDLLVEGYPRSANTFVLHALKWSNPELKYASHMHTCGPIKYAARKQIPMLVLIREPRSAVVSLAIRENFRLDYCLEWYIRFYRCVAEQRNSLVLTDFSTATSDLKVVYDDLRGTFGLSLRRPPTEPSEISEVQQMVVYSNHRSSGGNVNPLRVGVPTQEKRDAVPKVEQEIDGSRRLSTLLEHCSDLYHQLTPCV
ncbi:hypothetical protein KUF57_17720 [Mycolicibacterium sp. PAM1]|uniref:hypothetical protein n=1 Tax=Mycolicibacterium sp. PAM1 TaxID=2853535 RepID=UPI001C3DB888|nr:hypothetical protein [Mycolicibacterium sp. PAM1]MBV5245383.1 hypothetical protein [Mycolicibacterium sp. PAM1]